MVPSGFDGFEQIPVAASHVPAVWHWSLGVHTTGFDPVQMPLWHVSVWVQASPSLQELPFAFTRLEQTPVAGLQLPAKWHVSLAVQTIGLDPVQAPDWQVSVWVHALPSSQAVPFALVGFEQTPVAGEHVPTVWHGSLAVHTIGFDPVQIPDWHVSVCVHALPSLHAVPFDFDGLEQIPVDGSHVPAVWHWSLAVQTTGFDPVHTPPWQVSLCVQELPSLHAVPLGAPVQELIVNVSIVDPTEQLTSFVPPPAGPHRNLPSIDDGENVSFVMPCLM
jgi:hypothetical protein